MHVQCHKVEGCADTASLPTAWSDLRKYAHLRRSLPGKLWCYSSGPNRGFVP
jgi:hypothetical protein